MAATLRLQHHNRFSQQKPQSTYDLHVLELFMLKAIIKQNL